MVTRIQLSRSLGTVTAIRPAKDINRCLQRRRFHFSSQKPIKNRVFTSVRSEDDLSSLLLLSSTNKTPLITLWTASWCASCREVSPVIKDLITDQGAGEEEGGLAYAEVELDSPTIGDLPMRYTITSTPTLLSFSRQEAQMSTRITSPAQIKDKDFLHRWLVNEARRGGAGGAGGSLSSLFGR